MKRNAFDEARDQRVADEFIGAQALCNRCRSLAPKSDLSQFGAMCQRCYDAYCCDGQPQRAAPLSLAEKRAALEKLRLRVVSGAKA